MKPVGRPKLWDTGMSEETDQVHVYLQEPDKLYAYVSVMSNMLAVQEGPTDNLGLKFQDCHSQPNHQSYNRTQKSG